MGKNKTAVDKVLDYFIDQVKNGVWSVGDKIPSEPQLTKITGVSRSSVRSAIQQVVGIGAMETQRGKGTYLVSNDLTGLGALSSMISPSKETLQSLLEFRLILETGIAGLAARRRTPGELKNLKRLYVEMKENDGNRDKFVMYDMLFHETVAKASKNSFAIMTLMDIYKKKVSVFYAFNDEFGFKDGLFYHEKLIKYISEKDVGNARQAMHDHLLHALHRLENESKIAEK